MHSNFFLQGTVVLLVMYFRSSSGRLMFKQFFFNKFKTYCYKVFFALSIGGRKSVNPLITDFFH